MTFRAAVREAHQLSIALDELALSFLGQSKNRLHSFIVKKVKLKLSAKKVAPSEN